MKKETYLIFAIIILIILIFFSIIYIKNQENILLAPGDNAQFINQNIPSLMQAGEPYPISVEFRNNGLNSWTFEGNYRLGNKIHGSPNTFGLGRVGLQSSEIIAPGQSKIFTYWISAPQNAGTYTLQLQMLQEGVNWFGDIAPQIQVTVVDNRLDASTGNAELEPSIAWISRSSSGQGVWLINRPENRGVVDPGNSCPSGFGWQNTYLVSSQLNEDGTIARKKITGDQCTGGSMGNIVPWGDVPDIHKYFPGTYIQGTTIIPPHWSIIKSNGLRISTVTGQALEEFHPEPALIILPEKIIPDGQEHITQKCYWEETHFSEQGFGEMCYDATCAPGNSGQCPGNNTMINTKYIVYDYCSGDFCHVDDFSIEVPVNFGSPLGSVLRVSYTLTSGGLCTGQPVLTEEQWYAEGIGFVGFSNDHPLSPAPNSVDFHQIHESNQCLPYWDNLCKVAPYNYNSCCPPGHPQCTVYRTDRNLPTIQLMNSVPVDGLFGVVELLGQATDDIGIQKVEFYIDNYIRSTDISAPYSFNWNTTTLSNGVHKVTLRSYDASGNFVTTPIAYVLVNNTNTNKAKFISQDVPLTMEPGQTYNINITVNNTGSNVWTFNDDYSLAYQTSNGSNVWTSIKINLTASESITFGRTKRFSFIVNSPSIAGRYNFSWRMEQNGVSFGDYNPETIVTVINCGDSICNGAETCSSCSVDCGACTSPPPSGGPGGGSGGTGGGSGFVPSNPSQCNDKKDNDNDGLIDYPADLGCNSLNGNSEVDVITPEVVITEEEPEVEEGPTTEYNIKIVFWVITLVLVTAIVLAGIQIVRIIQFNKRYKKISSNIYSQNVKKPNIY